MTIYEFLTELSKDLALQRVWLESPQRAMEKQGVSEENQTIILSGDLARIVDAVRAEMGEDTAWIIWMGPTIWPQPGQAD